MSCLVSLFKTDRVGAAACASVLAMAAFVLPTTLEARPAPPVHFVAELAAPAEEPRAIAGGVVFHCEGARCIAPRSGDRPIRVCRELKREVGQIASFTFGGNTLDAQQLEQCNR